MKDCKFIILFILLVFQAGFIWSQERKKIDIEQADALEFKENIVNNAQRLIGNVILKHNNVRMWCDSAYSYTNVNMVDAFGKVHILKDDTLHLYANFINYNGDRKWAIAKGNVKLVNKTTTLTTDSMNFDMQRNIGYYDNHGTIIDNTDTLNSVIGEYYADLDKAYFKKDVKAVTKDYTVTSDTLIYFTKTGLASIVGPTMISDEENTLYTEDGFYNSKTGKVELFRNSSVFTPEQNIKADSIFYDKGTGDGLALGNADIHDIKNKLIVRGNKVEYNDKTEIAIVTDSAHFLLYSEKDTLFLHADTLKTMPDTIPDEKLLQAFYKVKFYRKDMQGMCDSMVYWSKDSTVQLFHSPVIWNANNQMTADYIELINKTQDPDLVKMEKQAFIIAMEDSTKFNQIKGRDMLGYIRNNNLYKIDVDGNGQSIYYAKDKTGIIGLNKAESSTVQIYLEDSKVKKIAFITSPEGELRPLLDIGEDEKKLPGFNWLDAYRPKKLEDIFQQNSPFIQTVDSKADKKKKSVDLKLK